MPRKTTKKNTNSTTSLNNSLDIDSYNSLLKINFTSNKDFIKFNNICKNEKNFSNSRIKSLIFKKILLYNIAMSMSINNGNEINSKNTNNKIIVDSIQEILIQCPAFKIERSNPNIKLSDDENHLIALWKDESLIKEVIKSSNMELMELFLDQDIDIENHELLIAAFAIKSQNIKILNKILDKADCSIYPYLLKSISSKTDNNLPICRIIFDRIDSFSEEQKKAIYQNNTEYLFNIIKNESTKINIIKLFIDHGADLFYEKKDENGSIVNNLNNVVYFKNSLKVQNFILEQYYKNKQQFDNNILSTMLLTIKENLSYLIEKNSKEINTSCSFLEIQKHYDILNQYAKDSNNRNVKEYFENFPLFKKEYYQNVTINAAFAKNHENQATIIKNNINKDKTLDDVFIEEFVGVLLIIFNEVQQLISQNKPKDLIFKSIHVGFNLLKILHSYPLNDRSKSLLIEPHRKLHDAINQIDIVSDAIETLNIDILNSIFSDNINLDMLKIDNKKIFNILEKNISDLQSKIEKFNDMGFNDITIMNSNPMFNYILLMENIDNNIVLNNIVCNNIKDGLPELKLSPNKKTLETYKSELEYILFHKIAKYLENIVESNDLLITSSITQDKNEIKYDIRKKNINSIFNKKNPIQKFIISYLLKIGLSLVNNTEIHSLFQNIAQFINNNEINSKESLETMIEILKNQIFAILEENKDDCNQMLVSMINQLDVLFLINKIIKDSMINNVENYNSNIPHIFSKITVMQEACRKIVIAYKDNVGVNKLMLNLSGFNDFDKININSDSNFFNIYILVKKNFIELNKNMIHCMVCHAILFKYYDIMNLIIDSDRENITKILASVSQIILDNPIERNANNPINIIELTKVFLTKLIERYPNDEKKLLAFYKRIDLSLIEHNKLKEKIKNKKSNTKKKTKYIPKAENNQSNAIAATPLIQNIDPVLDESNITQTQEKEKTNETNIDKFKNLIEEYIDPNKSKKDKNYLRKFGELLRAGSVRLMIIFVNEINLLPEEEILSIPRANNLIALCTELLDNFKNKQGVGLEQIVGLQPRNDIVNFKDNGVIDINDALKNTLKDFFIQYCGSKEYPSYEFEDNSPIAKPTNEIHKFKFTEPQLVPQENNNNFIYENQETKEMVQRYIDNYPKVLFEKKKSELEREGFEVTTTKKGGFSLGTISSSAPSSQAPLNQSNITGPKIFEIIKQTNQSKIPSKRIKKIIYEITSNGFHEAKKKRKVKFNYVNQSRKIIEEASDQEYPDLNVISFSKRAEEFMITDNKDEIKKLIKYYMNLTQDQKDSLGDFNMEFLLILAAEHNKEEIAKYIIDNIENLKEEILYKILMHNQNIAQIFVDHYPKSIHQHNKDGYSIAYNAARIGGSVGQESLQFLINNTIDINARNNIEDGHSTPLFAAIRSNDLKMTQFLVSHGAILEIKENYSDLTAIDLALQKGYMEIAKYLMYILFSKPDTKLLFEAAEKGDLKYIKSFVEQYGINDIKQRFDCAFLHVQNIIIANMNKAKAAINKDGVKHSRSYIDNMPLYLKDPEYQKYDEINDYLDRQIFAPLAQLSAFRVEELEKSLVV